MLYAYFAQFKDVLSVTLHLSRDALHVHVGLVLFLAGCALIRGERRIQFSFLLLLVVCLAGEMSDVLRALHLGTSPKWLGGIKDIVNTMFWPGVCLLGGPQVLRLLDPRSKSATEARPDASLAPEPRATTVR